MTHSNEQRKLDQLFREAAASNMSRRQMMQRASVLGVSAFALTTAFVRGAQNAMAQENTTNPLGVDPAAPLEIVIFKGGYGDEYAIYVKDEMYAELYPEAEIEYTGTQRLQEQYQARIVAGDPPDVMDNSGAGNFNTTTLYNQGQLAELTDLMGAPAFGQEDLTFVETLTPGTQDLGVFDGTQYVLKYVLSMYGIWYNRALFDEKGWEYPQTWDEMLAMCEMIKTETDMAPWTYQGLYPYYIRAVFDQLLYKSGGWPAILKIDNLAEDAWTQDLSIQAMTALQKLYTKDYLLEGTIGLSHTESQAFFFQGEAVFIPCGSWLENEMQDVIPEGYELIVSPVPSLTADDALPFTATQVSAGEDFIVFSKASNVPGGKEYLRLLFSQEAGKFFTEATNSLTVVEGAADELELSIATQSVKDAIADAGENVFVAQYGAWYADLDEASQTQFSRLMTGEATPEEVADVLQTVTNQIRENPDIPKFTREAPRTGNLPIATPGATPAVATPES